MDLNWFALSVKSRHEFTVTGELHRKGIDTFLPSVMKVRQWKDRKKRVEFPLFPGYVFVSIVPDPEEFVRVVTTRGTVRLLALEPGHPTPIPGEEINALKIIMNSGEDIDVYPGLKQGARVRVRNGVFQGAEGVLAKKDDNQMLLVSIDILGRSVGVRILAADVEAVK
jgi:transcription termination/antitermination protein NusG